MSETTRWINLQDGGNVKGSNYTPAFVVKYENEELETDYILSRGYKSHSAISEDSLEYEVADVSLLGPVEEDVAGDFVAGYVPGSEDWIPYDQDSMHEEDLAGIFEYEGPHSLETETLDDWLDTEEGKTLSGMLEKLEENGLMHQEMGW